MCRRLSLIALVVLPTLVAACSGSNATDQADSHEDGTEALSGVVRLGGSGGTAALDNPILLADIDLRLASTDIGAACEAAFGYSDIIAGAPVTIRDQQGTVVGLGELDAGVVERVLNPTEEFVIASCSWTFEIADVPTDRSFYSVEVANRGEVRYSASDLDKSDWVVELVLGGLDLPPLSDN